ncbi:hypothetical protein Baya_6192 [Bagarius yarrelli]|uniref:Uncharacterized protein n=1 Tax=Bagarius yarrelli TaxID=175774 RepID=A0A556TZW8_BAGYA|nr:hypothetical protein Baya_6192 [Bagarius yarrelli]
MRAQERQNNDKCRKEKRQNKKAGVKQLLLCMAVPKPFEWRKKKIKTCAARGYHAKTRTVVVTKRETSHCRKKEEVEEEEGKKSTGF